MKKLLLCFVVLLVGCQGQPTETKKPLRLGLVTWIGYGPFYVAQEKGFFKNHGIDVVLMRIEGDAERRAAIVSGDLNGSALTLDVVIVLRSQGVPVKAVMAIDASLGGDGIVAVEDVKSVKDLKGRQVAYPSGQPSHFFLYSVLSDSGMTMADVRPIIMDADKAGAAFAAGQVDVAVTWEPWLTKARETAKGHVLIDSKQKPGEIEDVLYMREDAILQRKDDIIALIKAWYDAVEFTKTNPDEAQAIMAKAFGLTGEEVAALVPKVRYEGREQNQLAFGTPENPGFLFSLYDRISVAWLTEGVIPKRDTPEEGLYPDFVRAVQ